MLASAAAPRMDACNRMPPSEGINPRSVETAPRSVSVCPARSSHKAPPRGTRSDSGVKAACLAAARNSAAGSAREYARESAYGSRCSWRALLMDHGMRCSRAMA